MMLEQTSLFPEPSAQTIVNVASVPHLSPFRYPGGKTWLVPRIRRWIRSMASSPKLFAEPFCGGGIVSLTVAAERLAQHVMMVELDEDVAAVWETCLSDHAEWLAQRIVTFNLTHENVKETLASPCTSTEERAFRTLLRNRINHGGILAPGSGILKSGENGRGIASRWYPETLAKRIRGIFNLRHRIDFIHGDGMDAIKSFAQDRTCTFFIDPPYTAGGKKAGSRLYTHSELDHPSLFKAIAHTSASFLMTYDTSQEIRNLAAKYGLTCQEIAMKNTHHARMNELLVSRNLEWLEN